MVRSGRWVVGSAVLRGLGRAAVVLAVFVAVPHVAQSRDVAAVLAERARTLVGAGQGVYVEAEDGTVLVSQAASRAVHPASVSKIPTTLALLERFGPEHRFTTRFLAAGPVQDGAVSGDLVVEADGDPYFVDENAALVALALRELGVSRVDGGLVLRGPLIFDWSTEKVAPRLERALEGRVPQQAWEAVREVRAIGTTEPPKIRFGVEPAAEGQGALQPLVEHRSQPLVPLLKALNGFSNNIFHAFAQRAGGVPAVQKAARASVPPALRREIVLTNGAGAGATNRLSPRAAVALLQALAAELAQYELTLADVLPVSGVDPGTLRSRLDGPGERGRVVGKTGTYGDYGASALAGALRTRDHGVVSFAVLNRGVPVPAARRRQDAFVRAMLEALPGEPWDYRRDAAPAFTRAVLQTQPRAAGSTPTP